jgi:hypothetical protein
MSNRPIAEEEINVLINKDEYDSLIGITIETKQDPIALKGIYESISRLPLRGNITEEEKENAANSIYNLIYKESIPDKPLTAKQREDCLIGIEKALSKLSLELLDLPNSLKDEITANEYGVNPLPSIQSLENAKRVIAKTKNDANDLSPARGRKAAPYNLKLQVGLIEIFVYLTNNKPTFSWDAYNEQPSGNFYPFVDDVFNACNIEISEQNFAREAVKNNKNQAHDVN